VIELPTAEEPCTQMEERNSFLQFSWSHATKRSCMQNEEDYHCAGSVTPGSCANDIKAACVTCEFRLDSSRNHTAKSSRQSQFSVLKRESMPEVAVIVPSTSTTTSVSERWPTTVAVMPSLWKMCTIASAFLT